MTAPATSAADVLQANDRGTFTVPSGSLYPYQWLWDAAFIALGWSTIDRSRAWDELDSVVRGQWPDGMLPHVVYHHPSARYFVSTLPHSDGRRCIRQSGERQRAAISAGCVVVLVAVQPSAFHIDATVVLRA